MGPRIKGCWPLSLPPSLPLHGWAKSPPAPNLGPASVGAGRQSLERGLASFFIIFQTSWLLPELLGAGSAREIHKKRLERGGCAGRTRQRGGSGRDKLSTALARLSQPREHRGAKLSAHPDARVAFSQELGGARLGWVGKKYELCITAQPGDPG